IAWAVAEHLHDRVGAKTLFATHYHELTALAGLHPRVRNVSVAAREWNGEVVFLRKLSPGGASRSFGVEVAKLAGLPATVVDRARSILRTLEDEGGKGTEVPHPVSPASAEPSPQLGLFHPSSSSSSSSSSSPSSYPESPPPPTPAEQEVLESLRRVDPDDLSP